MRIQILSLLLLILSFSSCQQEEPEINTNIAQNFLNEVLDLMEENSINRNEINWIDFRNQVMDKAVGAQTTADTYPAIEEALILLGDNHSAFITPSGEIIRATDVQCDEEQIALPSIPENIGYVTINSFGGGSTSLEAITYAEEIQTQIREQDTENTKGWIVDLRNNSGGNMWPMLAGCGPILGEGIAGFFIDPDNIETSWGYQSGASVSNGALVTQLSSVIELSIPDPKVAVILNKRIASSGEVIAISFIGRENTRSFGVSTCGLSTANRSFSLSDNSGLIITSAYLADRNKNLFGVPIDPDEVVENGDVLESAIAWIEN